MISGYKLKNIFGDMMMMMLLYDDWIILGYLYEVVLIKVAPSQINIDKF